MHPWAGNSSDLNLIESLLLKLQEWIALRQEWNRYPACHRHMETFYRRINNVNFDSLHWFDFLLIQIFETHEKLMIVFHYIIRMNCKICPTAKSFGHDYKGMQLTGLCSWILTDTVWCCRYMKLKRKAPSNNWELTYKIFLFMLLLGLPMCDWGLNSNLDLNA